MTNIRDELLGLARQVKTVKAPELGKDRKVFVLEPDGATLEALEAADYVVGDDERVRFEAKGRRARWAIACLVDEGGKPVFTAADLPAIAKMPARLLKRVMDAAEGIVSDRPGSVEGDAKNSSGGQA